MDKGLNHYEIISRAQQGDEGAKSKLIEDNMGLIRCAVKHFSGRGYESEDLFQVGAIGLIKAIDKFDLSFNVRFSTYAVPMIIGEIKRFIRDDGIIKVSRSIKELSIRASAVREALRNETGEESKICDIAQSLGVSAEEIAAAFEATVRPESLYASGDDGNREGQALIDRVENPENCEAEIVNRLLIDSALKELPKREQKIIILRYYRGKTQSQIAKMLGISQVQVSRIEKKVLSQMKGKIKEC